MPQSFAASPRDTSQPASLSQFDKAIDERRDQLRGRDVEDLYATPADAVQCLFAFAQQL